MSHLMQGQPAGALPLFEQVVAADSRHGMALEHLGVAQLMLGRHPQAETVRSVLRIIGLEDVEIAQASLPRLVVHIETPSGMRAVNSAP